MKEFMGKDFLLNSEAARILYHKYAAKMPIIDYHCHINPKEIYEDIRFENITKLWLGGDHYKWRLLRSNGVPEEYVTGNADDYEKFLKFAETLERSIGNPVHQWSHLELKNYFGFTGALNSDTADEVWRLTKEALSDERMSSRGIIEQSGVDVICTTDDPVDSLEWHEKIDADNEFVTKVYPAWRPDKMTDIEKDTFIGYIEKLASVSETTITDYASLKAAALKRLEFFHAHKCRLADHGLSDLPEVSNATEEAAGAAFAKRIAGSELTAAEIDAFKADMLHFFAGEYVRLDWTMQLHYGCKRNNNSKQFKRLGPDTGFDAIKGSDNGARLADLLNLFDSDDKLPRTILYSLNPNDNAVIETVMGCFQDSSAIGKIQHGSAWWFNDNKAGMEAQLKSLANEGVLGNFVGMLTDSRSFLSYTRHEYFRRILCNVIGELVENGEYPWDEARLGGMVCDISYNNAARYFKFVN